MTPALKALLKAAFLASVAAVLLQSPTQAQVGACPPGDGTIEGLTMTVNCLNETVSSIAATQSVLQRSILDVYETAEALGIEMKGPAKTMELIPASNNAVTKAFKLNGELVATFECAPLAAREGSTIFGADLGPDQPLGSLVSNFDRLPGFYIGEAGCSAEPNCRTPARQRCVRQARAAGCYINTAWLEWLRRQPTAVVDYDTVCKP